MGVAFPIDDSNCGLIWEAGHGWGNRRGLHYSLYPHITHYMRVRQDMTFVKQDTSSDVHIVIVVEADDR
ncbi:hypothetical protein MANY_53780 [Mycolicibacterium anyangense]|uniref:Uncharacterized protein n=1 Tax=Mycolicibacterium anyangense TaxID=1431246 RepID=A0A6N4WLQ9_9MYCO|nr:hypothetical protein MANY_53780 [Mycolicibacterium anyangense]